MASTRRAVLSFTLAVPAMAVLAPLSLSTVARAAKPVVYANNGIAIDGTDAVAYFTQERPVAGKATLSHDWMGVTWLFSSEVNRAAFAANPKDFAPQYGGYCAYAVSEGYTASTTPEARKVVNGKLYLNYSRRVQRRWERNIPERIVAADANWPSVLA